MNKKEKDFKIEGGEPKLKIIRNPTDFIPERDNLLIYKTKFISLEGKKVEGKVVVSVCKSFFIKELYSSIGVNRPSDGSNLRFFINNFSPNRNKLGKNVAQRTMIN